MTMQAMNMAHQQGCIVLRTERLHFFVHGIRCLAVFDQELGWQHDHYAVDEWVGLSFVSGTDGDFRYLRVAILGGHAHVGPVLHSQPATRAQLDALRQAASEPGAGLGLIGWVRTGLCGPAAA